MLEANRKPSQTPFILYASLLATVTYVESALLEYPLPWLGPAASLAVLALMVVAQLALCAALYRTVRRSADAYSVFFNRAALVALAAYLALTVLFLFPHGVSFVHHDLGSLAGVAGRGAA